MPDRLTYIFAGGGTGGHLFPGIAVAEELLARQPAARVLFVGSGREVEREIVAARGFEHVVLPVEPSTTLGRNPVRFAWRVWRGWRAARRMLRRERPAAVIGLGGFASVPVVLAAGGLRIPVVLLEQNAVAGRATRLLCRRAERVCLSFESSASTLPRSARCCLTGNPVRREIAELATTASERARSSRPTLLVLGGSQGAVAVNDATLDAAERMGPLLSEWRIVHQTGPRDAECVRTRYAELGLHAIVAAFFGDLPARYRDAKIAVSRAGATTLAELACAGCPALLLPYPNSVGDHQWHNARIYETAGAALLVEQLRDRRATAEGFARQLSTVLTDAELRGRMSRAMRSLARPEAAQEVVDCIERCAPVPAGRGPRTVVSKNQKFWESI